MSAKIIHLTAYRSSTVRCPVTGLVFPQLYRRRGVEWVLKDGREIASCTTADLEPGTTRYTRYELTVEYDRALASSVWEPITRPDRTFDSGWIIVRHHKKPEHVTGYIDAIGDLESGFELVRVAYETGEGLFTVIQRDPIPGLPDCLIAYITKVPHPIVGEDIWSKVFDPEGNEFTADIMLPREPM